MRIAITAADRCPQGIMWAPHFRPDGSCRCEARQDDCAIPRELGRTTDDAETNVLARRDATAVAPARR